MSASLPMTVQRRLSKAGALMLDEEVRYLADLAGAVPRDQEIVELGSWAGGSAAWLCAGSRYGRGAHITCVDPWDDWIDPPPDQHPVLGAEALARFGELVDWRRTTALRAASLEVAPMWVKPIGLLFIDALHTYEACMADYLAWSPHIPPGGALAVHDYAPDPPPEVWWAEGPTRAVDEIAGMGLWDEVQVVGCMWTARRALAGPAN